MPPSSDRMASRSSETTKSRVAMSIRFTPDPLIMAPVREHRVNYASTASASVRSRKVSCNRLALDQQAAGDVGERDPAGDIALGRQHRHAADVVCRHGVDHHLQGIVVTAGDHRLRHHAANVRRGAQASRHHAVEDVAVGDDAPPGWRRHRSAGRRHRVRPSGRRRPAPWRWAPGTRRSVSSRRGRAGCSSRAHVRVAGLEVRGIAEQLEQHQRAPLHRVACPDGVRPLLRLGRRGGVDQAAPSPAPPVTSGSVKGTLPW